MKNNNYFKFLCVLALVMLMGIIVYNAVTAPDLFVTAIEYTSSEIFNESSLNSSSKVSEISSYDDSSSQISAKIDINNATAEEMASALPSIGEVIAQRIIDYRNMNGVFRSLEEIKNVKGIGDKIFEKIKDLISVS